MKAEQMRINDYLVDEDGIVVKVVKPCPIEIWNNKAEEWDMGYNVLCQFENGNTFMFSEDCLFGIIMTEKIFTDSGFDKISTDQYILNNDIIMLSVRKEDDRINVTINNNRDMGCYMSYIVKNDYIMLHQIQHLLMDLFGEDVVEWVLPERLNEQIKEL